MTIQQIAACLVGIAYTTFAIGADDSLPDHARSATQMSRAGIAFVQTLDAEQRAAAVFDLKTDERAKWSNLPIRMVRPSGLLVGDMTDGQRAALHDLLRASMSSQGYAKITGIMRLDDLLYVIDTARLDAAPDNDETRRRRGFVETRNSGNYAVGVFGDPSGDDWGWKIAGHHGAANFTVSDGRVGFTPTFVGSNPADCAGRKVRGLDCLVPRRLTWR